jgi:outer membrane lipoprotein carrier protein
MKHLFLLITIVTLNFASLDKIYSFEADFTQNITDEKKKVLTYKGHIIASKPLYAKWEYTQPVRKDVYINTHNITIIEPELEQAIVKEIESKFDFFYIVENAKKIKEDEYEAFYKETKFIITSKNSFIESISYKDEFDNQVNIIFENQKQNIKFETSLFIPNIPIEYDVIRD